MFHATLLMIPTCFMHIICHIYAFSGTNLLTRCRRASCCFLLFSAVFGFRNPSKEIFSELDETFAQGPIFARSFQKTEDLTKWGHEEARGWPARPKPWPRRPIPWAPRVAPRVDSPPT